MTSVDSLGVNDVDGLAEGRWFGPYRVLSTIGSGGMGVVYRAQRDDTGETVALKTTELVDPAAFHALRREISALRRMNHEGIVRLRESGFLGGVPWYTMDLLEGDTLADLNSDLWTSFKRSSTEAVTPRPSEVTMLRQQARRDAFGPRAGGRLAELLPASADFLRPAAASELLSMLRLYLKICAPLAYLHGLGMVHRDLNPRNVFVRADDSVVLMDFGLWTQIDGGGRESLGAANPGFGSVNYIAPEQILGRSVDARADLYALGCMLYETVTGAPPFSTPDRAQTLRGHLERRPIAPSRLVSDLPVALDELILSLLAKTPEERLGHAEDVSAVLAALIGDTRPQEPVHPSVGYLYRPRLAGRHEVVSELTASFERATRGKGGLLLVSGESGIGKTFVVNEAVQRILESPIAGGANVVTGACQPASGDERAPLVVGIGGPLHPLRPLLEAISDHCAAHGREAFQAIVGERGRILGAYEPGLEQLAVAHGVPPESALPSSASRDRILTSLQETLRAFAKGRPLLLLLDDLQWADDLTLAFLRSLTAEFFEGLELLILGTFRAEESLAIAGLAAGVARVIRLGRIDNKSVAHVIGDMLALREPPDDLVAVIERESAGNPFLVAEYLRLLVSERLLSRRAGRWEVDARFADALERPLPAPNAVDVLVKRRLSSLSGRTSELVNAASVLGSRFDPAIAGEVLGFEPLETEDALLDAVLSGVLVSIGDGRYAFTHDKIRESLYRALNAFETTRLHARAARVIEARLRHTVDFAASYGEIAQHFIRAGEPREALVYLERAGVDALERSANADAVGYLRQALDSAAASGQNDAFRRARWFRQIGDALQGLGKLDESVVYLSRAAESLGMPVPETNLQYARSLVPGVLHQVVHRLVPSFLGSRRADSEYLLEAARVYDRLQQVYFYQGKALPIVHAALTSLNLSELAEPSPELINAYANAHAVSGIMPAPRLSATYRERALDVSERVQDSAAKTYLAVLAGGHHVGRCEWRQAERIYEEAIPIAKQIGFRRRWEELVGASAVMQFLQGRLLDSMQSATGQYQSAQRGDTQTQCWGLLSRALVFSAWDQQDHALRESGKAEALVPELGRPERLWAYGVGALAALRTRDFELARQKAERGAHEVLSGPPVAFYTIAGHAALAEVWLTLWARELAAGSERTATAQKARALVRSLRGLARVFPAAAPDRWFYEGYLRQIELNSRAAQGCFRRSLMLATALERSVVAARVERVLKRLELTRPSELRAMRSEGLVVEAAGSPGASSGVTRTW